MRNIVDFLMPNNCRAELQQAASKNSILHTSALCLIREHRDKLIHEITTPRALQEEMLKPFAVR